jgi:AcrR family transcriptional regulator
VRTRTPLQAEKILRVAARLFATQPFHATRMEDVAAAAEVGKGTVYRYFKDKDELFLALLAQAAEQMAAGVRAALDERVSPVGQLEGVVRSLIDFFDEQPHLFDLISHADSMHWLADGSPWQQMREEMFDQVRGVFVRGQKTGVFATQEPDLAVLLLLGGVRAVIRFGNRPRPADLPQRIVDHFLSRPRQAAQGPSSVA